MQDKKSRPENRPGNGKRLCNPKNSKNGLTIKYMACFIGQLPAVVIWFNGRESIAIFPTSRMIYDREFVRAWVYKYVKGGKL